MPCSCTVVTQSGVSGISYNLDPDQYVVDLYVDNQCQGPSFASFDQSMTVQCFTDNPVASAQKFLSSDAVSWECNIMPRPLVLNGGMPYLDSSCRFLQICDSFCTGDRNYAGTTLKSNLAAIKICSAPTTAAPTTTTAAPTTTAGDLECSRSSESKG